MIELNGSTLKVSTCTTEITLEGGRIISIKNKLGREFIDQGKVGDAPALSLLHMSGKEYGLVANPLAKTFLQVLSDNVAQIIVHDWECDAALRVSTDEASGDVLIEPSCYSMMTGLHSLRMNLAGIDPGLNLVLPLQQGCSIAMDSTLIRGRRFEWPNTWEAGFAVFDGGGEGFSVQAWDDQFCTKALKIGAGSNPYAAGFETCARGPLDEVSAIGGLVWRISCHQGDWTVPVKRYRDWYWRAYGLAEAEKCRPDWLNTLKLAISWCPTERYLLDDLKKLVNPSEVFIHLPNWRLHEYDQDYPTYIPNETGRAFVTHARSLGYHVAPHCNACQISPDHPLFGAAVNYSPKHITEKRLLGWSWLPMEGWARMQGPPQSYSTIAAHKEHNVLVNVHTGWSGWRQELERQIAHVKQELLLDSIFVDVSQWIYDADRSVIENMTYAQGSLRLLKGLSELSKGFCVSGEARNEINVQSLSVSQLHLFDFAHTYTYDGKDVSWLKDVTLPVNDLLFKGLNRGIGYSYGQSGYDRRPMIDATAKLNALPTLIMQGEDYLESEECRLLLSMMK